MSPAEKWLLFGLVLASAAIVALFYAVILIGAFTKVWGFDYTRRSRVSPMSSTVEGASR